MIFCVRTSERGPLEPERVSEIRLLFTAEILELGIHEV